MVNYTLEIQFKETTSTILIEEEIKNKLINKPFTKFNNNTVSILNTFFGEKQKVANVFRYTLKKGIKDWGLSQNKNTHKYFEHSIYKDHPIDFESKTPTILLILESPHKDEFCIQDDQFVAIAPAQGYTGKSIKNKLVDILKTSNTIDLPENEYNIIIVNPVPYQTSLFEIHKKPLGKKNKKYKLLRDNVWVTLWENEEANLKNEFRIIVNKIAPKLIINACTKELSEYLKTELLKTHYNKFSKCKICHPSSWFSKNNRKITLF